MKKITKIFMKILGVFIIIYGISDIIAKPHIDPVCFGILIILIGIQVLFIKIKSIDNEGE